MVMTGTIEQRSRRVWLPEPPDSLVPADWRHLAVLPEILRRRGRGLKPNAIKSHSR